MLKVIVLIFAFTSPLLAHGQHKEGQINYRNGDIYTGEQLDEEPHGFGTMRYSIKDPNSSKKEVYIGQWAFGKRSGRGRMRYADGTDYIGYWKDDLRHGEGALFVYGIVNNIGNVFNEDIPVVGKSAPRRAISTQKGEYTGDKTNSVRDGQGTMRFRDKSYYSGEWKDNLQHGYGALTYADGTIYEGRWIDNVLDDSQRDEATIVALERLAQEEADRLAQEEAERIAKEKADRLAQEEADRLAQEERNKLAAAEQEERNRLAAAKLRYDAGDFSDLKSCTAFGFSNYEYLNGAMIRPDKKLKFMVGVLYDFSEDTLSLRGDNSFYLVNITDSPHWVNESSTAINDNLSVIGYYEENIDTTLTTGADVKVPVITARCISKNY